LDTDIIFQKQDRIR